MSNSNDKCIFWASFMTLIAAGIGFSVRGAILGDWGRQFGFTQSELGEITGGGLTGFGITIILLSFIADKVGYGKLMILAFLLHALSAVVTFAATPVFEAGGIFGMDPRTSAFWCLNIGMWLFALGNGTCEAVINPLTATLFPTNKTHWLNILHAGWPGGLTLGALITVGFNQFSTDENPIRWEYKLGVFVVPVLIYGLLMLGRTFPKSEATSSGVSMGTMIVALISPILIFLWLIHGLIGYVELGTDSWITNITETVLENQNLALGAFIWTNVLMFTLRFFAGPIVHKISPLGLLFFSAVLGTAGLWLMGQSYTNNVVVWIGVVTVYGIGKTFYWPTMLGVISERYPKAGALALGVSGGIGMICAGLLGGPGIGYKQDYFATAKLKETSSDTYDRYRAQDAKGFPYLSPAVRSTTGKDYLPDIAGLDNAKVGVLLDDSKKLRTDQSNLKAKGESNENLNKLESWWNSTGKPNSDADKPKVVEARLFGGKQAMLYTAVVPAAMAIGYLLLILLFKAMGGYKQVHLGEGPPSG
jgi:MFS family permease